MHNHTRRGAAAFLAIVFLAALSLAGCDREDRADVERSVDEAGEEAEEAWNEAEPEIREGLRDAGEVVGKGVEAAGEVIQRGGEELQEEARDTTATTLPDTVASDTVILE